MASPICTKYVEDSTYDLGTCLLTKEYLLEIYPSLVPGVKSPGLWSWGFNGSGQLGTNDIVARSSPVQTVAGGTNWRIISSNNNVSSAIKTDGTLWVWGCGSIGRLGTNNTIDRSSPVQTVSGGTNWSSVSADSAMGAIKTDGTLWMWGNNPGGRLGTNDQINRSSPVQTVAGGTNWRSICTAFPVAATKTDGTLWLWGDNIRGALGTNNTIDRSSPVQTVSGGTDWLSVSTSNNRAGAIKCDGTLWMWGYNSYGVLGTNNRTAYSSPVQTVAGGTNWRSVSLSYKHAASVKTDGTLWLWGYNCFGRLGTNNTISYSSPVQTVAGGTNWKCVLTFCTISSAIKTDGTLWMWGYNCLGGLGTNDRVDRSSPVQTISGGTGWRSISGVLAIRDEEY